ncbi:MAG TPA: bifunctional diaminohydroxyphosphoribosylaminopyrimidine deaminase/5-amino-6-(5-phosphoribosylamino)uracil reductase RibD [Steroidobacteraceae bacterium]|nr:bifunctional diaminohydroxyphosphoribosylaminopyrimidine deaminase/5-amino-6-(5-phosphoribosylamino)uracil reductase RibD [Steroidobacteraceae bacterium]
MAFSEFDRRAMGLALKLAERGLQSTHPNPRVGCVIARGQHIIAEGWHERAGEAHAEIVALRAATESVEGATVYVTLEPCSHHGRTPPCANALVEARVGRVVLAVQDPNPRVSGQGAQILQRAGITVDSGLLESEAIQLNPGFMKRMREGIPWVQLKLAMSLDGRTALASGASRWITGEAAREDVQRWRARSSAIMTGIGTVLSDDPRLDVRLAGEGRRQPIRVILDGSLRTPPQARLFTTGGEVLIMTGNITNETAAALAERGARVEWMPGTDGKLDLRAVLERLGELEVNELLVEAGATLAGQLISESLVDECLLYIAPRMLGPQARALVDIPELQALDAAPGFTLHEVQQLGEDLRLRLRPC